MQNTSIRSSLALLIEKGPSGLRGSKSDNVASLFFQPRYQETAQYTTLIPNIRGNFDRADVYYPIVSDTNKDPLPVALFLQGALVDRADYANFANIVASYGFVVVVPDRIRSLSSPITGKTFTGAFAETSQIYEVLDFFAEENLDSTSPVNEIVDPDKLVLLGHSFGGAVGLSAINDSCIPGLCTDGFSRPEELVAGVFFGTNLRERTSEENNISAIDNDGIPVALI